MHKIKLVERSTYQINAICSAINSKVDSWDYQMEFSKCVCVYTYALICFFYLYYTYKLTEKVSYFRNTISLKNDFMCSTFVIN